MVHYKNDVMKLIRYILEYQRLVHVKVLFYYLVSDNWGISSPLVESRAVVDETLDHENHEAKKRDGR